MSELVPVLLENDVIVIRVHLANLTLLVSLRIEGSWCCWVDNTRVSRLLISIKSWHKCGCIYRHLSFKLSCHTCSIFLSGQPSLESYGCDHGLGGALNADSAASLINNRHVTCSLKITQTRQSWVMLIKFGDKVNDLNNLVAFMLLVAELAFYSDNVLNFSLVKLHQSCHSS